jgi:hypothetical protein
MDILLQPVCGSVISEVSSFVAGRDSPMPREVMNIALSSVPLPLNPSTYDLSFASAFSVHHPNFNSGSLDNANFIRGGSLRRGPHIHMPEVGVFYQT